MQNAKLLSIMVCLVLAITSMLRAKPLDTRNSDPLDRYNVVWRTPSRDSSGSMPLGSGDIGLNLWV